MKSETKQWLYKHGAKIIWIPVSIVYINWGNQIMSEYYLYEYWYQCFGIIICIVGYVALMLISITFLHWMAKDILRDYIKAVVYEILKDK